MLPVSSPDSMPAESMPAERMPDGASRSDQRLRRSSWPYSNVEQRVRPASTSARPISAAAAAAASTAQANVRAAYAIPAGMRSEANVSTPHLRSTTTTTSLPPTAAAAAALWLFVVVVWRERDAAAAAEQLLSAGINITDKQQLSAAASVSQGTRVSGVPQGARVS